MNTPKILNKMADVILAYRPKPKSDAAKKRERKRKKAKGDGKPGKLSI
jgi:hypothetical protein